MSLRLLRLLVRPRWIALLVLVAIAVVVFVELSQWQLRRLDERRAANAIIEAGEAAAPVPAAELLAVDRPLAAEREWRPVVATGTYDPEHELLVRYRYLDGRPGFHVLTPLVTDEGPALLVDRGWIPRVGSATELPEVPAPARGEVTATGRLRVSETGDPGQVGPATAQIRYIDVPVIAQSLPYPVYGGYAELLAQNPPVGASPQLLPPPERDDGPHLSYALQWLIFAVLAVGGVGFLAYDEVTGRRRVRSRPDPEDPPCDGSSGCQRSIRPQRSTM